jgi:hypothetical protein
MSESFDPRARALIVPVLVVGPRGSHTFKCVLDTGAMRTSLPARAMWRLGIDVSRPLDHVRLHSATGNVRVPLVRVPAVSALARVRTDYVVVVHDLPIGIEADGVLGLDFFRGFVLRIDFARGHIDLDPPKRWWQVWRAA